MLLWPWVFFGVIKAKHGIQMSDQLSGSVARHPHQVGAIVTLIGTINRLIATLLFGKAVVRLGQEVIAKKFQPEVTVFGVSALLAFRHMTMVWGVRQWGQLVKAKGRLVVVLMLLLSLGALALIPSGTASLLTPGEFKKTAALEGTELDFTSDDSGCLTWLDENKPENKCDWKPFGNTSFTACLGENQILDVLDSGRAKMIERLGISNETSSLNQLGGQGGIRFLGSTKGVLPIGPNGVPAFDSLGTQGNPLADPAIRRGIVSYNYTLDQQGLETNVDCFYESSSPISNHSIPNSAMFVASNGTCAAAGLERVLANVTDYPTVNVSHTLTYWACKQSPSQGSLDPTYFIYLRGRGNYEKFIGNITCGVSPMRARDFEVGYHSEPRYFASQAKNTRGEASQRRTFARFIDGAIIGLGSLISQGQNWESHLVADAVFSMATRNSSVLSFDHSPTHLRLFEAMIQGVLEYEGTYSRLIYSMVRGWFIDDSGAQAGLLIPMLLVNLTSLALLFACFIMGQFRYTYDFDATDSMSLLTALVMDVERGQDGKPEWHNKVRFKVEPAQD
ncbi:hypothetical protein EST38_g8984 [Candolleomyces aberdarensis]|uniref:Uncharacterized protein n=1 Tax=Candolleomyces aberdarensis TaxID=2316362 RepID=A0A4Q2DCX0_9AGAR|nr:hypothetical protein EST38_g8984 [Candolleomyces aberdarensis]